MGKRRTRRGQSGRSARNGRKYILGGIAAVVVIIAAAAVLWQFFGKADSGKDKEASQNGAGQTVQSGEKTDQADDAGEGEEKQSDETAGREDSSVEVKAGEILESMTLEEKVCQLFMITPEGETGATADSAYRIPGYCTVHTQAAVILPTEPEVAQPEETIAPSTSAPRSPLDMVVVPVGPGYE